MIFLIIWHVLDFSGQNISADKIFGGQNFSADKIFGSKSNFRQFCPPKFCPIRYVFLWPQCSRHLRPPLILRCAQCGTKWHMHYNMSMLWRKKADHWLWLKRLLFYEKTVNIPSATIAKTKYPHVESPKKIQGMKTKNVLELAFLPDITHLTPISSPRYPMFRDVTHPLKFSIITQQIFPPLRLPSYICCSSHPR